jgi:hypothetical protein
LFPHETNRFFNDVKMSKLGLTWLLLEIGDVDPENFILFAGLLELFLKKTGSFGLNLKMIIEVSLELFALVFHPEDFLFEISFGGKTGFPSEKSNQETYEKSLNEMVLENKF